MKLPPSVLIHSGRRAFTLIELLAVVVIIGILAALIFPSVKSSQKNALDTKTVARMKILSIAYLSHMADNNMHVVVRNDPEQLGLPPTTGEMTAALAPFLQLPETGLARLATSVWWDGMAEKNGNRLNSANGEGDLYYPGAPAWPGGPPRSKLTGLYFNPFAHEPKGTESKPDYKYAFTTLGQVQYPGKTALLISRRADGNSGATEWNSWSDGKKYSTSNPPSIGAKRIIGYFDGHVDMVTITGDEYSGGSPRSANEVRSEYIFAEPVFYAWPGR